MERQVASGGKAGLIYWKVPHQKILLIPLCLLRRFRHRCESSFSFLFLYFVLPVFSPATEESLERGATVRHMHRAKQL